MPVYPNGNGNAIFGRYERVLVEGGRFSDCGCKPTHFTTPNGDVDSTGPNGSCWHTLNRLTFIFVKAGWDYTEAFETAMDMSNRGFLILHYKPEPEQVFAEMWKQATENLSDGPKRAKGTRTPKKGKSPSEGRTEAFTYVPRRMDMLLDVVEGNPGIHVRGIQQVLLSQGWRRGHVDLYLERARERGLVRVEVGTNRMRHHFLVMRERALVCAQELSQALNTDNPLESLESSTPEEASSRLLNTRGNYIGTPFIGTPDDDEHAHIGTPGDDEPMPIGTPDDDEPLTVQILERTIHCETPEEYERWLVARDDLLAFLDPERNEPLPVSTQALMTEWKSTGRW